MLIAHCSLPIVKIPDPGNPAFGCSGLNIYFCSMEMTMTTPVTLTPGALAEIRRLMAQEGFDTTQVLRVGVKGGGCSGMSYILGFDHKQDNDNQFEIEGITCVMNKSHEIYLYGMEVDWQDGLNNRGFTFRNPNASSTCGCGTSFAV
ncbi:MAG TPA: iron-sulfur cluster assembly accessory protein [Chitinophagaceae bacterium]|nr:iron-sulfur cluster assembly accessory protein [Chitinophagaceae bacterium]